MGVAEVGKLLREQRQRLGLTQAELGTRVGMSRESISNYENGDIQVIADPVLRQFSGVLGVGFERLIALLHDVTLFEGDEQEIAAKWRALEFPPDITTDEIVMLKHLFRGIRGYESEILGPQIAAAARQGTQPRAKGEGEPSTQPLLVPVERAEKESG